MPKAAATHYPHKRHVTQYKPPEPSRQKRRALATNSAAWRKIRAYQLMIEPFCRICAARGRDTAASVVDHINGDATNDDPSNHQSLCSKCHNVKTAKENGGFGNRRKQ